MKAEAFLEEVSLHNGAKVVIRSPRAGDEGALLKFFRGLPEEDRLYLGDDVTTPDFVTRYLVQGQSGRMVPLVAEAAGELVGNAALYRRLHGWTTHVGQIRVAVARNFQRQGLGKELARCLVKVAMQHGVDKLVAEVADNQTGAKKAFEALGFKEEALLKGQVKDALGRKRDLCILSNDVSQIWEAMEALSAQFEGTMDE
jgi:ribosomal protein S18 acetylase RimI-like enzyme